MKNYENPVNSDDEPKLINVCEYFLQICIVNDPRETSGYGKALTVDCLSNMVGGRPVVYNNQPIEVLMNAAVQSIKNNEPVWYGCDVGKKFTRKLGFEDLDM